jgi:hypothetical protein
VPALDCAFLLRQRHRSNGQSREPLQRCRFVTQLSASLRTDACVPEVICSIEPHMRHTHTHHREAAAAVWIKCVREQSESCDVNLHSLARVRDLLMALMSSMSIWIGHIVLL